MSKTLFEKRCHEIANVFTTDEELKHVTIFGLPIMLYTKRELAKFIGHLIREKK